VNNSQTQRAQFRIQYKASEDISLSGEYIHRAPRIPFNSFFSVFNPFSVDEFEGGVDVILLPQIRTYVRGAFVDYKDENSFRYTFGAASEYVSASYRGNTGYAGELSAVTLNGAYPFFERVLVPAAAISFTSYRLNSSDSRENAFTGSLGATLRPIPSFSLDLQLQWLRNRILENDVRFFGKVNYWFSERLSLFE
jgi:hypothetical protein